MKKIILMVACAALFASCGQTNKDAKDESNYAMDSLQNIIEQKDSEMNDLMGTINDIQTGFDMINEAQGRIKSAGEGTNAKDNIKENLQFIQQTLEENKKKIEDLQKKLDSSNLDGTKLKATIESLQKRLTDKTEELELMKEQFQAQLAEKDAKIAELDDAVNGLKDENAEVRAQKEQTEQIAKTQDMQLNTAYYMYGTSKELKKYGVLANGEVLQGTYNKNDFIRIDIRKTTVIPLDSKGADILTSHPAGSYSLLKDSSGKYTLRITDANKFWSSSKFLVIKVK